MAAIPETRPVMAAKPVSLDKMAVTPVPLTIKAATPEPPAFTDATLESPAFTSVFLVVMSLAYEDIKAFPIVLRLASSLEDTADVGASSWYLYDGIKFGSCRGGPTDNCTPCYGDGYLVRLGRALRFN